jgi:phosphoglycerate dehydrogenase-like enzyme
MTYRIIYFENVAPAVREIVESCKGPGMDLCHWSSLAESEKAGRLAETDVYLTGSFPVTRQLIAQSPCLKLIQKAGVGLDNIDLGAAEERGILVSNTPGTNTSSVAEQTIGAILALYRKLVLMDRETRRGKWLAWEHRATSFEMGGKTHGIIGLGRIGRATAELSRAFGTTLVYYDIRRLSSDEERARGVAFRPFEQLLAESDIVSLHVPLTESTRNMIDAAAFARMKSGSVLINVARGGVIDEPALARALSSGHVAGAAIDTWTAEPPAADHPLFACETLLATPHVAGGTREAFERAMTRCFRNVERLQQGAPLEDLVTAH